LRSQNFCSLRVNNWIYPESKTLYFTRVNAIRRSIYFSVHATFRKNLLGFSWDTKIPNLKYKTLIEFRQYRKLLIDIVYVRRKNCSEKKMNVTTRRP